MADDDVPPMIPPKHKVKRGIEYRESEAFSMSTDDYDEDDLPSPPSSSYSPSLSSPPFAEPPTNGTPPLPPPKRHPRSNKDLDETFGIRSASPGRPPIAPRQPPTERSKTHKDLEGRLDDNTKVESGCTDTKDRLSGEVEGEVFLPKARNVPAKRQELDRKTVLYESVKPSNTGGLTVDAAQSAQGTENRGVSPGKLKQTLPEGGSYQSTRTDVPAVRPLTIFQMNLETAPVQEKPARRVGRLAVPSALADKIADSLSRKSTIRNAEMAAVAEVPNLISPLKPMPMPRPSPVSPDDTSRMYDPSDDFSRGGYASDDALSDGGEFYDNDDVEFMRPSEEVLLKSIPIVASQQHIVTNRKGYLFKYISQKSTISKLGSQWQKRWVTIDSEALKYFSNNKSYVSKRVIPVSTMVNLEQDVKNGEVHPFQFRLKTVDRVYRFATDTSDDLAWWSSILMHAVINSQRLGFRVGGDMHQPNTLVQVRMDGIRSKRWLAIKNGKCCFYNTKHDFDFFSPVHQVDLQLVSVKDIGKGRLQMQTPQVGFVFLFDSQDELNVLRSHFEVGIAHALGDSKVLDEVYENTDNKNCADCRAPGPEWAAVNMGITLCQNCAGIHRTLINAKVRSLTMDSKVWKPPLIELMKVIGNSNANKFWEWSAERADLIDCDADSSVRTQFINAKYKDKRFCNLHQLRTNHSALNELLCKTVQQDDVLETMRLVFSGADVTYCTKTFNGDGNTPYQLAEEAKQTLQMEFLLHNGGDATRQQSAKSNSQSSNVNSIHCDVSHCGYLWKAGPNAKFGFNKRWCVLQNGQFSYFETEKSGDVKDTIDQHDMISVAISVEERIPFPFELVTTKQSGRIYIFGADSNEERQEWLVKFAMCISPTPLVAAPMIALMSRGGLAFVKLSGVQDWKKCWLHLYSNTVYACLMGSDSWEEVDLRKATYLKYLPVTEKCLESFDNGPPIYLDLQNRRAVYIQGENKKETESWYSVIQEAMIERPTDLSSQALTADDVPIIVDKLINFVTNNGLHTEGIYRLCGQNSVVTRLLEMFEYSSFGSRSAVLRTEEYMVHDATNALKRFLRNLDDSVLMKSLRSRWLEASAMPDLESKLKCYKRLLIELPPVNYSTLRKLIFHLSQVTEFESENKMGVTNLATTFGPVLFNSEVDPQPATGGFSSPSGEIAVVRELLENHRDLFQIQEKDLERERQFLMAQQKLERLQSIDMVSDGILLPIYIENRFGKPVNIKVPYTMKAGELLAIAIERAKLYDAEEWVIQEVVCNEELARPVHSSETAIDIVMRWGRWPEEFSRNNYLVVRSFAFYQEIFKRVHAPGSSLCCELKYTAKKSFKKYFVELNQNILSYRKEKADTAIVSWRVNDLVIYCGIPVKRAVQPQRFGFTFISLNTLPVSPYFGHSICCSSEKEMNRWLTSLLFAQHSDGSWSSQSKSHGVPVSNI